MLTRNPAQDPLAAISRECRYVFPRWVSSSRIRAPLDPIPHPRIPFSADLPNTHYRGSVFLTNTHQRGRLARPAPPFFSLEPSFTGAGKKAAYARLTHSEGVAAADGCSMISTAHDRCSKRVNITLQCALTRSEVSECGLRNRVSNVKYREGDICTCNGLKKTALRPLEPIPNYGFNRTKTRDGCTKNTKGGGLATR